MSAASLGAWQVGLAALPSAGCFAAALGSTQRSPTSMERWDDGTSWPSCRKARRCSACRTSACRSCWSTADISTAEPSLAAGPIDAAAIDAWYRRAAVVARPGAWRRRRRADGGRARAARWRRHSVTARMVVWLQARPRPSCATPPEARRRPAFRCWSWPTRSAPRLIDRGRGARHHVGCPVDSRGSGRGRWARCRPCSRRGSPLASRSTRPRRGSVPTTGCCATRRTSPWRCDVWMTPRPCACRRMSAVCRSRSRSPGMRPGDDRAHEGFTFALRPPTTARDPARSPAAFRQRDRIPFSRDRPRGGVVEGRGSAYPCRRGGEQRAAAVVWRRGRWRVVGPEPDARLAVDAAAATLMPALT